MNTVIAAFTTNGITLARRLSGLLGGEGVRVFVPERLSCDGLEVIGASVSEWAGRYFGTVDAMVFVGACGIAVRAIAQHITTKTEDPAVIVVDEAGRYVIPILSGHIGGANALARKIASFLEAQAVITTATDINNLVAVDEWAISHNCAIENPEAIKYISGSLLEGHSVGVAVTEELIPSPFPITLWLRPKVLVLGAGCHRGTDSGEFERAARDFLDGAGVSVLGLKALASVNLKEHEPALNTFAARHGIPFMTFSAQELQALTGRQKFSGSDVVKSITGTDNVCERSAVMAAGEGAVLLRSKCVYDGMTFALARVRRSENDTTA